VLRTMGRIRLQVFRLMRYDECFLNHMPVGKFCAGARSWHFERPDGSQFTACETHRSIWYDGLKSIPCRTD
jgi:hypothetical protein